VAFFCTDSEAGVVDILEAAADRGALKQTNKDVNELGGRVAVRICYGLCGFGARAAPKG
jgi:hypothetical protein